MPRVLIAGCGYVGQATAALFYEQGWEVEGWTSSAESAEKLSGNPYPVAAVDISQAEQVAAHARDFDAVIHCASSGGGGPEAHRTIYLQGARSLLGTFSKAVMLFTSSTSVYAQTDGAWVTELSPAEPARETGRILRETEALVLSHGGVITRLAGIYGPGRCFLLQKFLEATAVIDRERDPFVNQVHRDDIASALFLLIAREVQTSRHAQTIESRTYNVVDDQPILRSECYEWLAAHLRRPLPPFGMAIRERKRGYTHKRVSNAKLRALGWKLHYPTFAEAMKNSILPAVAGLRC